MGDYWSLQFRAKLHIEYVVPIRLLLRDQSWTAVAWQYPLEEFITYSGMDRCKFIPFGAIAHTFSSSRTTRNPTHEWNPYQSEGLFGDEWCVSCSTKSFETLHYFCQRVLGLIASSVSHHCLVFEGEPQEKVPILFKTEMASLKTEIQEAAAADVRKRLRMPWT